MSDRWEVAHGSNPARNDPWEDRDGDGWTNFDEFLNYAHNERMAGRQVL
jgi:hypothetical protein